MKNTDNYDCNKQDTITNECTLKEYKNILIAFLADFTKLEPNKFDAISIIEAKNYHEYKLIIDDTAICRKFYKKTQKTEKSIICSGYNPTESQLWNTRTELLQDIEQLKTNGNVHFDITLSDCISVIECPSCHGNGTEICFHCNGQKVNECISCNGIGEIDKEETVDCPRCAHLTNPGWIGSRVCEICGDKNNWTKKIKYKGQVYKQRIQDGFDILNGDGGSGKLKRLYKQNCHFCKGTGKLMCETCKGTGTQTCSTCGGNGRLENIWLIEQKLIEHKKSTMRIWIEQLPIELEKVFYKTQSSPDIRSMSLFRQYINSGKVNLSKSDNVEIKGFRKKTLSSLEDIITTCRKSFFAEEYDYLVGKECIELYRKPVFTKILFQYLNQTYCMWVDCNDKKLIYDFTHDGFTFAWNRAKEKIMQNHGSNQKEFSGGVNYLEIVLDNLSDNEKKTIPNEIHSYVFNPNAKAAKNKENNSKAKKNRQNTIKKEDNSNQSVSKASKKAVIQSHENATTIAIENITKNSKSRNVYTFLALILPGVHNLYAGYIARGCIQLLIVICSLGLGVCFTWPWALYEASFIKNDAKKNPMCPGWAQWIPRSILVIMILIMSGSIVYEKIGFSKKNAVTTKIENNTLKEFNKKEQNINLKTIIQSLRYKKMYNYTKQQKNHMNTAEYEGNTKNSVFEKIKNKITLPKILIVFVIFAIVGIIMACCDIIYLFSGAIDIIISAFLAFGTALTLYFFRDNTINDTEAYCLLGTIGVVFIILSLFTTPGKYWAILFVFPGKVFISFLGMITILFVFKSCLEFFRKDRRNKGLDIFVFLLSAAGIFGIGKLISMTTRKKVNRSDIY